MKNKGFTLIELLVVIAIIGLLSSVVLVSLNSARNKGKDSRVVSTVQQIRTLAESGFDGVNYNAVLSVNDTPVNTVANAANFANGAGINDNAAGTALQKNAAILVADALASGGKAFASTGTDTNTWAIYGQLVSDNTKYFCIDSTGGTNASKAAPALNADWPAVCN